MPYAITNMGLQINLATVIWTMNTSLALLSCKRAGTNTVVGIFLRHLTAPGQYVRAILDGQAVHHIDLDTFLRVRENNPGRQPPLEKVVIRLTRGPLNRVYSSFGFHLGDCPSWRYDLDDPENALVYAWEWDSIRKNMELPEGKTGTAGVIVIRKPTNLKADCLILKFGYNLRFNPVCSIERNEKLALGLLDAKSKPGEVTESFLSSMLESNWLSQPDSPCHIRISGCRVQWVVYATSQQCKFSTSYRAETEFVVDKLGIVIRFKPAARWGRGRPPWVITVWEQRSQETTRNETEQGYRLVSKRPPCWTG
jgi:hypothetical protein